MKLYNYIKKTVFVMLPLFVGVMSGCTDDFEDINTNPNEIDAGTLPLTSQFQEPLTYVYFPQQNLFQYATNLNIDLFGGYFMTPHNFGGSGNADYSLNRGFCGGMYEAFTLHIFNKTSELIPFCEEKGFHDYAAVLRIVQAYGAIMTTDAYGPMEFTCKLEGADSYYYDTQETIYKYLFTDLEKAVSSIKTAQTMENEKCLWDYWCKGDKDLWIKIANTLRLRMAIRISKVDPSLAKTEAEKAYSSGVLTDADKDIVVAGSSNELYRMMIGDWFDCGVNATLSTMLTGLKDPRLPLYLTKNVAAITDTQNNNKEIPADSEYLGIRAGCNLPAKMNAWCYYSKLPGNTGMALPIMKVAEAYFLRAEGALRGWNMGGTAKDLYETGIRTSIKNEYTYRFSYVADKDQTSVDVSDAAINAYINDENNVQADYIDPSNAENNYAIKKKISVKWEDSDSNEQKLQRIITQKWLALFPISTEAWAEFRRTGYPEIIPPRVNLSEGTIDSEIQIRRLLYSDIEVKTNATNYAKGVELLIQESQGAASVKGDNGGTQTWWDTNAGKSNF